MAAFLSRELSTNCYLHSSELVGVSPAAESRVQNDYVLLGLGRGKSIMKRTFFDFIRINLLRHGRTVSCKEGILKGRCWELGMMN